MIDKYGRNINYLRVSVTDLCQYRCSYCIPEDGIKQLSHKEMLSLEEMYYIIHEFARQGVNKIRFTGGEPLIKKGLLGLIDSVSRIDTIKDIALTTNGVLLEKMAHQLKRNGLNRVNISLDTLNSEKYTKITKTGNLSDVIKGIDSAVDAGLKVKFNTVLMKGINDDEIKDLIQLTKKYNADVRFIELMPIGLNSEFAKTHFMSFDQVLGMVDLKPSQTDDMSAPTKYFRYEDNVGKVGFITAMSSHFCDKCNRMRLTVDGKLKPCLHSNKEIDVKASIRNCEDIGKVIQNAILSKPQKHMLDENYIIERGMSRIGG